MSTLVSIARGWYNYTTANECVKGIMEKRLSACDTCPHKQQLSEFGKLIVQAINKEGSIYKCGLCSCPLAAKASELSERCGDNRW